MQTASDAVWYRRMPEEMDGQAKLVTAHIKMITILKKIFRSRLNVMACIAAIIAVCMWALWLQLDAQHEQAIALLVPDDYQASDVEIWQQAASEQGVNLEFITASAFLRPLDLLNKSHAGIIVPDSIHKRGNAILIDRLKRYVHDGGKLMLVYDALTLDLAGNYPADRSRLSDLAGVDYAMYSRYGDHTAGKDTIGSTAAVMRKIGITPGRYNTENPTPYGDRVFDQWLTTYQYAKLEYPIFGTGDAHTPGNVLLLGSRGSVAASENAFGSGKVLFVNLPLGFLQTRTDGLLLHGFLRYFTDDIVGLARLLSSPKGIGGLVLNIHVDSNDAIPNLNFMQKIGVLDQGPYSIHFTAGPDVDTAGDGKGMNAEVNPITQAWIRKLAAKGHAIGNHGGWIHNHFGMNVAENNRSEFEPLLVKNDDVMTKIVGRPLVEYAAPNGNHPSWVTDWLVKQKVLAYYTTANGGGGATRMADANGKVDRRIWSMPVTPFGRIASFEEAMFAKLAPAVISKRINELSHFVADSKNIRMIYCHPPGVQFYAAAVTDWLKTTGSLARNNVFKWYTMTDVAQFMSRRESTAWSFTSRDGEAQLTARHPQSLLDMTWIIQKSRCEMPQLVSGQAIISSYPGAWQITAADVTAIKVTCSAPATSI